jgi:hypothetical protein
MLANLHFYKKTINYGVYGYSGIKSISLFFKTKTMNP